MFVRIGKELEKLYRKAKKGGYAFAASNVAEPNVMIGLIEGSERKKSDLVLQLSRSACEFAGNGDAVAGLRSLGNYMENIGDRCKIGVFLNMDHLKDPDFIEEAVQTGIPSSIMIDASEKNFEENVEISKNIVEICKDRDVLVEAELGRIKGVEDNVNSPESYYTDPEKAVDFVRKTGCDLLAISIGTQHGVSKGIDLDLRMDIAEKVDRKLKKEDMERPLVVHGSTGLTNEQMKKLAERGVCKFNKDTRYQYEYARTAAQFYRRNETEILPPDGSKENVLREGTWSPNKEMFDPRVVSGEIRENISEVIGELAEITGSAGKSLYC